MRGKTLEIGAKPGRPPGQISRAQGCGFHHHRAVDGARQDIGEKLHGDGACGHAAVDAQHGGGARRLRPIGVHGGEQVAGLVADRLQRCAREFGGATIAGKAENRRPRLRIPIGRAQPDKGRHQIDLFGRIGLGGKVVGLGRLGDDLEAVAQPLHRGAGDEDRAFQRVSALAVELIGDCGEQPVARGDALWPGIEQRKTAGAVSRFQHAGLETALPDGCRLLVAGDAEDANGRTEQVGHGDAEFAGAVAHFRQQRGRHAEQPAQTVVPHAPIDIEQQRARGIGGVGRVHLAAGQPPEQETVDGAESEPAGLGELARALHMLEQPGDLAGGEIRVEQQAGLGDFRFMAAAA